MASAEPRVSILPGEMRLWTDLENARRPAAGGPTLIALLREVPVTGRVLVLGPHSEGVLSLYDEATVVVRSLSDAEAISAHHPDLQVVSGDFSELSGTFDLVVALDGVERLSTNDRPFLPFADRLTTLAALVAPGGRLVLGVDNDASVLALADARPLAERRDTGDWDPPVSTDRTRPAGAVDVVGALASHGLAGTAFAATWRPTAPSLLVDLDAPTDDVRIRAALADVAALAPYSLLFDPVEQARQALRRGSFADAASGWTLVLGRDAELLDLPAVIVGGEPLTATDLADAPGTRTVLETALDLAQREDLAGLRALMCDYLPWVAKEPAAHRPDFAVVTEGGFTLLPDVSLDVDPVAATSLWLARRLLAPDMRRIWPPWLDEYDVARSLAAMAGLKVDQGALESVPELALMTEDVRTLKALNEQLRQELVAARGEVFAHERLATTRDRQLERRSVNLAKAEARMESAERRVRQLEEELRRVDMAVTRRAARAMKDPRKVARKVKGKLKKG